MWPSPFPPSWFSESCSSSCLSPFIHPADTFGVPTLHPAWWPLIQGCTKRTKIVLAGETEKTSKQIKEDAHSGREVERRAARTASRVRGIALSYHVHPPMPWARRAASSALEYSCGPHTVSPLGRQGLVALTARCWCVYFPKAGLDQLLSGGCSCSHSSLCWKGAAPAAEGNPVVTGATVPGYSLPLAPGSHVTTD